MPIIELTSSRTISYQEGNPVGVREFHVSPYTSEAQVQALFGNALPGKYSPWPSNSAWMGTLPAVLLRARDYEITRDPNVTNAWNVRIIYKDATGTTLTPQLQPADDGYVTVRLSSEARFVDAWRQWSTGDEFESTVREKCDSQFRPRFTPGTPQSDIKGRKIDVAGYPTSVLRPVQRMVVDITTVRFPRLADWRYFLGTRNLDEFSGVDRHTAVFTGGEAQQMQPGRWIVTLNFDIDQQYHLQQVVARNASGFAQTDPGSDNTALATGQAAIVSWVQPFPIGKYMKQLHPALQNIP